MPAPEHQADGETVGHLNEAFHTTLVRTAGIDQMKRMHGDVTRRNRTIRRLDFSCFGRV